jgi:hypothetical protein
MDASGRRRNPAIHGIWVFLAFVSAIRAESAPTCQIIPVQVQDDRCEFVLPTEHQGDKYYLIVGSLARDLTTRKIKIRAEPTGDSVSIPRAKPLADDGWERKTRALAEKQEKARRDQPAARAYRAGDPPKSKDFYLLVKDRDFLDPSNYTTVTGELRAVGKHCQVYVDHDYSDADGLQPTIKDAVAVFDDEIYPKACERLGQALDVDRDGRFTILFTPWLGKLSNGKVQLDGFVRGSDFYRDLDAPHGNRCDMMYLNTNLKPGPYLRTLLAHEYTHAVDFSEHVFGEYLPNGSGKDEEGWLNEGLAHLNEDAHAYSWHNLDYRISTFLAAPERYSVVVSDYYAAGLFRSHGHRGATYLFLRWCEDQIGPEMMGRLARSNLTGTANLEAATGRRFAELFRGWSASLLISGSGMSVDGVTPFGRFDLRKPLEGRLLCGPRVEEVPLDGANRQVDVAGTSAAYFLLHSPDGARSKVTITADAGADLQVTLIRLPRTMGRLSLRWEKDRLLLTARDAAFVLDSVAWERLPPESNRPEDTSYRPDKDMSQFVRDWFGGMKVKAGESRRSAEMVLPEFDRKKETVAFKVSGTDENGMRVAAWVSAPQSHTEEK